MVKQEDLAEAVGVTRHTIGLIESGEYNPTLNLCIAICKVLGKTLNDLLWEDKELPRVPPQFDGMKPGELLGDLPGELLDFGGQLFLAAEVADLQVQTSQSRLLRYIV